MALKMLLWAHPRVIFPTSHVCCHFVTCSCVSALLDSITTCLKIDSSEASIHKELQRKKREGPEMTAKPQSLRALTAVYPSQTHHQSTQGMLK